MRKRFKKPRRSDIVI